MFPISSFVLLNGHLVDMRSRTARMFLDQANHRCNRWAESEPQYKAATSRNLVRHDYIALLSVSFPDQERILCALTRVVRS